ncbi:MAG: aminodeoxychorismate/anthranilate synthase component II [Bacillota bacterium]|nr:aminodeoxychorismate/anthranilate synthase component II [Bacillota bacterium]
MILIIDNYDSFTFNLAQELGSMGLEIEVRRNDAFTLEELEQMPLRAVFISPGPGEPGSAGLSLKAVGYFKNRLPVLGICLGHQVIGAYFGARVVRASRLMHGKTSLIHHHGDSIFMGIDSPFEAMRYHSLLVSRDFLPPSLEVIAATEEGEIMAIRHKIYGNLVGLQFHPESLFTPHGRAILNNFCRLSGLFPAVEFYHPEEVNTLEKSGVIDDERYSGKVDPSRRFNL